MLLNNFLVACNTFSEKAEVTSFCYNHYELPALLEHQLKDKNENVYWVIILVGLLAKSPMKDLCCMLSPLISSHPCLSVKDLEQKENAWKNQNHNVNV